MTDRDSSVRMGWHCDGMRIAGPVRLIARGAFELGADGLKGRSDTLEIELSAVPLQEQTD